MSWSVTYAFDDEGVPYENVKFNTFKVCDAPNKKIFHFTRGYTRIRVKGLYTDSCHTSDNLKLQNVVYDFILDVSKSANNCITGVSTDRHLKATWNAPLGRNLLTIQPNICSGGCSTAANDPQKFIITVTEVRGYGPLLSSYRMMTPKKMLEFEEDPRDRYKYFVNVTDPEEIKIYAMQIKLISAAGDSPTTFETPLVDTDQSGLSNVLREELYYKEFLTSGNVIANELFHDFRRLELCNQHDPNEDPDVPDFHLYMEIFNHNVKVLWDVRERALSFVDIATGNRMKMEILKVIYSHTGDLIQNYTLKNAEEQVFQLPYHPGEKFDITNGCRQIYNGVKRTTGQLGYYSWLLPAIYQKVRVGGRFKSLIEYHHTNNDDWETFDMTFNVCYNVNNLRYNTGTGSRQGALLKCMLKNDMLSMESVYKFDDAGDVAPAIPSDAIYFKNYDGFPATFTPRSIVSMCNADHGTLYVLQSDGVVHQGLTKNGTIIWRKLQIGPTKTINIKYSYNVERITGSNNSVKIAKQHGATIKYVDAAGPVDVTATYTGTTPFTVSNNLYKITWDNNGTVTFEKDTGGGNYIAHPNLDLSKITAENTVSASGNALPTTGYDWKCIAYNDETNTLIVGGFTDDGVTKQCHIYYYVDGLWWERDSFIVSDTNLLRIANAGNECAYMTNQSNVTTINYINVPTIHETRIPHETIDSNGLTVNSNILCGSTTKIAYVLMNNGSTTYSNIYEFNTTSRTSAEISSKPSDYADNVLDIYFKDNKFYYKIIGVTSNVQKSFLYEYENDMLTRTIDFGNIDATMVDEKTITRIIDNYIIVVDTIHGVIYYRLLSAASWKRYPAASSTPSTLGTVIFHSNENNAIICIPTGAYASSKFALFNNAIPRAVASETPNFDVELTDVIVEGPVYVTLQEYIDNYSFEKTYTIKETSEYNATHTDRVYKYELLIPPNESPTKRVYRDIKGFTIMGTVRNANCSALSDFVINGMDYRVFCHTPMEHKTPLDNPAHYRAYTEGGRYYIETVERDIGPKREDGTRAVSFAIYERKLNDGDASIGCEDGVPTRMEITTIKYRETDIFQKCFMVKDDRSSVGDEVATPSGYEFKLTSEHKYLFKFNGRKLTEFTKIEVLLHAEFLAKKSYTNGEFYGNPNIDKNVRIIIDGVHDFVEDDTDCDHIDSMTMGLSYNGLIIDGCYFNCKCIKTVNGVEYYFKYDYRDNSLYCTCGGEIVDIELEYVELNGKKYTRSLNRDEKVLPVEQPIVQYQKYEEYIPGTTTVSHYRYHTSYRSWSTVAFINEDTDTKSEVEFTADEFGNGNENWEKTVDGVKVIWTIDNILKFDRKCVLLSIKTYDISREIIGADPNRFVQERSQLITFFDVDQILDKPPLSTTVDELNEYYTSPSILNENEYEILLHGPKTDGNNGRYCIIKTYNYYDLLSISFTVTYKISASDSKACQLNISNAYLKHDPTKYDWEHTPNKYTIYNYNDSLRTDLRIFYGNYIEDDMIYISVPDNIDSFEVSNITIHGVENWRHKREEILLKDIDYEVDSSNNVYTIYKNYKYLSCVMKYKITGDTSDTNVWIKRIDGTQGRTSIKRDENGHTVRAVYSMDDESNRLTIKYFGTLQPGKTFTITSMKIYGHPPILTTVNKFMDVSNKIIRVTKKEDENTMDIILDNTDNITNYVINLDVYNYNHSLKRNYTVDLRRIVYAEALNAEPHGVYNLGHADEYLYKLYVFNYTNTRKYKIFALSSQIYYKDVIRDVRIRYIKHRLTGAQMKFTINNRPGEFEKDLVVTGLNGFTYYTDDGTRDNTMKGFTFVTCDNNKLFGNTLTLRIHEANEKSVENINYPEHRGTYTLVTVDMKESEVQWKYRDIINHSVTYYEYQFYSDTTNKYQAYFLYYYPELNAIKIFIRNRDATTGALLYTPRGDCISTFSIYSINVNGKDYFRTATESKLMKYVENESTKMIDRHIIDSTNKCFVYKYAPRDNNVDIYISILRYTYSDNQSCDKISLIPSTSTYTVIDTRFDTNSEPWLLTVSGVLSSYDSGTSTTNTTSEIYRWYRDGVMTVTPIQSVSGIAFHSQCTGIQKIVSKSDTIYNYSKIATENYVKEAIGESVEKCNKITLSGGDLSEFQTRSEADGSDPTVTRLHEFVFRRNYKNVTLNNDWSYTCAVSTCPVSTSTSIGEIKLEGNFNDTVHKFVQSNHFGLAYVMLDGINKILMMKPSNAEKTILTNTGTITLSGPIITPKSSIETLQQNVKPVEITYETQKCIIHLLSGWLNGIRDYIITFDVYNEGITREIIIDTMEMNNTSEANGVITWRLKKDCYTFECKNIYNSDNKAYNFSFDCMNERGEYRRLHVKKIVYANGMVEIPIEYNREHHDVDHKDDYYTLRNINDELVVNYYNNNLENCTVTMLINGNIYDVEGSSFNYDGKNYLKELITSTLYLYRNKETNGFRVISGMYTRNSFDAYIDVGAVPEKSLIIGDYTSSSNDNSAVYKKFSVILTLSDDAFVKYFGDGDIKSFTWSGSTGTGAKRLSIQDSTGTDYHVKNCVVYSLSSVHFDILAIKCDKCIRYIPREPSEIYTYNYPNDIFELTNANQKGDWYRVERNYSTIKFKFSYEYKASSDIATYTTYPSSGMETITIEGDPLKPTVLKWNHYKFTYVMHHNYNLFKYEEDSGLYQNTKFNYIDQPSSDTADKKVTLCGPLKTYINDFHDSIKFPKETDEDYTEYTHKSERNPEERLHNHQLVLKHTHNAYEFDKTSLTKYVIECDIWNNNESLKERVSFDCGLMKHRWLNLGLDPIAYEENASGPLTMFAKGKRSTYTLINDSNVLWMYDDTDMDNRLGPLVYRIITVRERQSLIEIPFTEDSAYVTTRPVNTGDTGASETKDYPHYCAGGYEIVERKYREYEFSCDGRLLDEFDISMYIQADDLEATDINKDKTQESRIKSNLLTVDFGYDRVSSGATIPDADEKAGGWIREGCVIIYNKVDIEISAYNGGSAPGTYITDDAVNKCVYKAGDKGFQFTTVDGGRSVTIPVGTKVKNVSSTADSGIPGNTTKILDSPITLTTVNTNLVILELPENPVYKWKLFKATTRAADDTLIKIEHFCTHNMIRVVKIDAFDYAAAADTHAPLLGVSIEKVTLRSKTIPIPAKITLAKTNSNVPFEFHRNYTIDRDSANEIPGSHVSVYRTPYRCRARFTYVRGYDGFEDDEPNSTVAETILEDGEFILPTDNNEWFIDGYKDTETNGNDTYIPAGVYGSYDSSTSTYTPPDKNGTHLRYRVDGHRIRIPSIKWNEDGTIIAKMDLRYEWTGTASVNNARYYFGDNEWFVITSITALDAMNHEIPREYATVNDIFALKDDLTGAQEHETCMVLKSDDNKYQFVLSDEADITTCTIKGYIETLPFEISLTGSSVIIGDTDNSGYTMYYSTDANNVVTIYAVYTTETTTYIPLVFSKIYHGNVFYKIIQDDSIETSADIIPIYIPYKLIATPTRSGANYSFLTRFCRVFVNIKNGSTIVERLIFDIDDVKGTKFFAKNNKLYNLTWDGGAVSCNQDATALAADAWEISLVMRLYNLLDKTNITQDNINKRYTNKTEVYCNVTADTTYDASAETSKEYIEKNNGYLVPSDDNSKFVFFISDYLCVKHTCDVYVDTSKTASLERVTHCDNYSFNTYTCTLASGVIYDVYLFKDDTYNVLGIVNKSTNAKGINLLTLTGITKYFTNEDSAVYEDNKREIIQEGTDISTYTLTNNNVGDDQAWNSKKHILTYTKQIGIYKFNKVAGHEDRIVYIDNLNKSWYQFINAKDHVLYWKDNKLRCCKIVTGTSRKWGQPNTNGSTFVELVNYTPSLPFSANDTYKLVKCYTVDKTDTDNHHFVLDPVSYKRDNALIYELPLLDKITIVNADPDELQGAVNVPVSEASAPASNKTLCTINYDISKNEVVTVESTDTNKKLKCKYWFERSLAILIVELRNNTNNDSFKIYIPPDATIYRCMMKEEYQLNDHPLKITEKQSARKNYEFSHDFASLSQFKIEFICADKTIHTFDCSRIEKNETDKIGHKKPAPDNTVDAHGGYNNIVTSTESYASPPVDGDTYYRMIIGKSWKEFVLVKHIITVDSDNKCSCVTNCDILQILGIKSAIYIPTNEYIDYEFEGISTIGESSKGIGNSYMNDNNFILMRKDTDKYTFTCGPYPISTYEIKLEYPVIIPSNYEYCIYIYNHNDDNSTKEQIADTNPAIYGFLMKTVTYNNKNYKYYLVVDSQEIYIMVHDGSAATTSANLTIEIISVKSLITGKYMSGVDSGKSQESVGININDIRYDIQTINANKNYFIQENLALQSIKFINCSAVSDNDVTKDDNKVYSTLGFKIHKFIDMSIAKTISYNNVTIEVGNSDGRTASGHTIYITDGSCYYKYMENVYDTNNPVYKATVKYNGNTFVAVIVKYTVIITSSEDEFYYMLSNVFGTGAGTKSLMKYDDKSAFPVPTFTSTNLLKTNADGKKEKYIYTIGYTSDNGAETIRASKGNNIKINVDDVDCTLEIVDKDCKMNNSVSMLYKFIGGTWVKNTAETGNGYLDGNFSLINGIYIFDCILHKSSENIQCILYNNHLIRFDKIQNDNSSRVYINRYLDCMFKSGKTKIYVINLTCETVDVTSLTTKVLEIFDETAPSPPVCPSHTSTFVTCYYACELNETSENKLYKHTSDKDYPSYYLSAYNPLSNAGYTYGTQTSLLSNGVIDYNNITVHVNANTSHKCVTIKNNVIYGDESKLRTILNGTIPSGKTRFCIFTDLIWNTELPINKPKVKHGYIKLIGYKGIVTPFDSTNLDRSTISIIEGYQIEGLGNHNFKINPNFQCQNGYNISSISDMYMPPKPIFNPSTSSVPNNTTVTPVPFQIVNLDDNGSNIRCIAFGDYLLRGNEKVFGSDYNDTFKADGAFTKLYTLITNTTDVQSVYVDYVNNSSYKFDDLPEKLLLNTMKCTIAIDNGNKNATPDLTTQYGFYGYKLSGLHKIDYNLINYITFQNDENILITNVASLVKFNEKLYYNPTIVEQNSTAPVYNNVDETFYIVEGMIKLSQWETSKKCIIIHDYILMCEISQFMNCTSAMDKIIMTEIKIPYPTPSVTLETKLLTSVQQYKTATDYVYTFTSPDFYQQLKDSDYYEWKYDNATIEIVQGPRIFKNTHNISIYNNSNCFIAACKVSYTYGDFTINYKGLLFGDHIICEEDVSKTMNDSYTHLYDIFSDSDTNNFTAITGTYFIKEYDENVKTMKYIIHKTDVDGVKQSLPQAVTIDCYNTSHINIMNVTRHNFFNNIHVKILESKDASDIHTRKKESGSVIDDVEMYSYELTNDKNKVEKGTFLTVYNIPFGIKYEDIINTSIYDKYILFERDTSSLIPVRMKFTHTESGNTYTMYGYHCPGTSDYLSNDFLKEDADGAISYNVSDLILTCYDIDSSNKAITNFKDISANAITINNKQIDKTVTCNLKMKEKGELFSSTVVCLDEYLLIVHTKYYGNSYNIANANAWIKSMYYSFRKPSGTFEVSYKVYEWTLEETLYDIKLYDSTPCCTLNGISYLKFKMVNSLDQIIPLSYSKGNADSNVNDCNISCKNGNGIFDSGFGYENIGTNLKDTTQSGAVCDLVWNGHKYLAIATTDYIVTYTSHSNISNMSVITSATGTAIATSYSLEPCYIHIYRYIATAGTTLSYLRQSNLLKSYLGFKVSHLKYYICNDVPCTNATVKFISDESIYDTKSDGAKRIYILQSTSTYNRLDTYYIMASITTEDKEYTCVVLSDYAIIISKQEFASLFGTNSGIVLIPQSCDWLSKPILSAPSEKLVTIKYPAISSLSQTTNILVPDKTLYIANLHLRDLNLKNIIAVAGYTFILLNVANIPNIVMKVTTHTGTGGIRDSDWSGSDLFIDGDTNVDRYYAQYANALALLDSGTTQRCLIVGEYVFFSESHIQTIENALSLFKNIYIRDACTDDCEQDPPST